MKHSLCWIALAALAASGCVDQRSAWRRSQRPGAETPFWNVPAVLGWRPLDGAGSLTPPSFLFPTAAVTREDGSLPMAFGSQPGLAPIFDVFRDEIVSERGTAEPLPMPGTSAGSGSSRSWSDLVAAASSQRSERADRSLASGDAAPPPPPPSRPSLPRAVPVPGKNGFVTLPGHPEIGEIDVMGIASGTPVEVPAANGTSVQFLVP